MEYQLQEISGNSYVIRLLPKTAEEESAIAQGNAKVLSEHFRDAVREKFGTNIHIASLTLHQDDNSSATLELISESGSV